MSKRKSGGKAAPKRQPSKAQRPLLSVGIIFKNEIRCLERCLKSLQPLREKITMEIVMADTGSDDGSREIAARYADILFDFPWIDDFAAARNAVLDRCSGVWCLTVDCDEWLDGDIDELVDVIALPGLRERYWAGTLRMFNYYHSDPRAGYAEFMAMRLFLRASGLRYEGAIHEHLTCPADRLLALERTVLHHDGYVDLNNSPEGRAKKERNIKPLREELKKHPDDLRLLMECAESAEGDEQEEYTRQGIEAVREKKPEWKTYGPPVFRNAIQFAAVEKLPELTEWHRQALELFPDSLLTQIDMNYVLYESAVCAGEIRRVIPLGEAYLAGVARYRKTGDPTGQLISGGLRYSNPERETLARLHLAGAYHKEKRDCEAAAALAALDAARLMPDDLDRLYSLITELQGKGGIDLAPVWARFGEGMSALAAEDSDLGRAAAMLEREDPGELSALLAAVEDWKEVPGFALAHALVHGAAFPPPGRTVSIEKLTALAARLPKERRVELACGRARPETAQEICWADALALSAIDGYDWKEEDPERSFRLARAFAEAERVWLPLCCAPSALRPENLFLLSPIHRFGFFCARAFEAADKGDELGYVRALRQGLEACEQAKPVVEFLAERRPEPRPSAPKASPELLALAGQVRAVLSRFAPDDPAVAELKNSPVYQRVAYLLEEPLTAQAVRAAEPAPPPPPVSRPNNPLDQEFFGLLRACAALGEREVFSRLKKGFLALPEQLRRQQTDYLNRYPLWGSFNPGAGDFTVLEEKARSLTAHGEDYAWLYGRLEDYRSKKLLYAILSNWARFDFNTLNACVENCFDDYFDIDVFPCGPGEVVADLGAYVGDTAVSFVRTYGPDAYRRYYCYEISPDTMEILKKNTAGLPNLVYRQKGAGERAGTMYVHVGSDGSANTLSGSGETEVEVAALDEDIGEPITVLKMDIEGAEQAAIRGAARHIREDRPKMALSVYHNNEDLWKVPRMVDELCPGCRFYLRYHGGNLWPTEISLLAVPEGR